MRVVYMVMVGYVLIGCSKTSTINEISYKSVNQFSCENKTEPKSLEFLEQKYHCKNKK
ncbi:MAG: Unknown protein [uncultured Sulfurovum sp.]|uniref:Lipoprotein n=1 Tax=uncultured Sulfurovum sp. TaxID=269237 RepID=A0A6S6SDD3_9BACT|nr:MAG: Unknown protein [uncultured Sulfurovum sp.]